MSAEPTVAALVRREDSDYGALVRPAASMADIEQAFKDYQELTKKLLTADDYQNISGKRFVKKSGWRKLAVAFGVTFEIRDHLIERGDDGKVLRAEFIVRASAPNGRFADGWGLCSRTERSFSKPEHDIPATAETRAKNRAASDLFGMGAVSAEEITYDQGSTGGRVRGRARPPVEQSPGVARAPAVPQVEDKAPGNRSEGGVDPSPERNTGTADAASPSDADSGAGGNEDSPPSVDTDAEPPAPELDVGGDSSKRADPDQVDGGVAPVAPPTLSGPATEEQWHRAATIYGSRVKVKAAWGKAHPGETVPEEIPAQDMYDLIMAKMG
jgi:hypothetical protein